MGFLEISRTFSLRDTSEINQTGQNQYGHLANKLWDYM